MRNHPCVQRTPPIHQTLKINKRMHRASVIPCLYRDLWYDRNAHTSRIVYNQSPEPRQQTGLVTRYVTGRKSNGRTSFSPSCLLHSQRQSDHPSRFFLLKAATWCLSKKVDFQSTTWASNWLKTCAQVPVAVHISAAFSTVNNSRGKVFTFSQSLAGVSELFQSQMDVLCV